MLRKPNDGPFRIVLTGGPGGGKTTAADLFRREIGARVVIVPEAATLLFSGGFPRSGHPDAVRSTQRAIYHVQRNLENVQGALFPERVLLCDRGTIDGGVYWPTGPAGFFESIDTTLDAELTRYDAVLFFETAAAGDNRIEGGNPVRIESDAEALRLDTELRALWSRHPSFTLIPNSVSFIDKLQRSLRVLAELVAAYDALGHK